jgi:hypothetical protein
MNRKRFFLGLILIMMGFNSKAQVKNKESLNQLWFAYFNQTRFSNKWGLWADFHLRTKENFVDNFSTSIARLGGTYYLTDNTKFTLGYAYVSHYPGNNHKNVTRPEHRIWQQVQWHSKFPRLRLMQYLRLEERFLHNVQNDNALAEGYTSSWRFRYNFFLNTPLGNKPFAPKTFSFVLNDEIHVNFGKNIVYNYFDQNRFFIGLQYHTNASDNIQFGYMNLFQQLASGNSYRNIHAFRVFYIHNLDLRKK